MRCTTTNKHFFVDISHSSSKKFIAACEQHGALTGDTRVFTTHKHADHAGGNAEAAAEFQRRTGAPLIVHGDAAIDRSPGVTHAMRDGDVVEVGALRVRAIQTPCHTAGSMCYHVTSTAPAPAADGAAAHPGALFTGDTLFVGGVGFFFEGNASDMVAVVRKLLAAVPDPATQLYCGHDYALDFLPTAAKRDPSNAAVSARLKWAEAARAEGRPAMPTTLADELETNYFVRCVTHTAQTGALYPAWNAASNDVPALLALVYDSF